jgi:hypothetical protein
MRFGAREIDNMTTGYTSIIEERDVTFAEFAKRCVRAMGAAIHMRDDPLDKLLTLPEVPEVQGVDKLQRELDAVQAWSVDERQAKTSQHNADQRAIHQTRIREYNAAKARYQSLIAETRAWMPPTAGHQGLKDFMLEQLKSSMDWLMEPTEPPPMFGDDYQVKVILDLRRQIANTKQYRQQEAERTAERRKYLTDLLASLGE